MFNKIAHIVCGLQINGKVKYDVNKKESFSINGNPI
jgi:hypothetical protein